MRRKNHGRIAKRKLLAQNPAGRLRDVRTTRTVVTARTTTKWKGRSAS